MLHPILKRQILQMTDENGVTFERSSGQSRADFLSAAWAAMSTSKQFTITFDTGRQDDVVGSYFTINSAERHDQMDQHRQHRKRLEQQQKNYEDDIYSV